MNNDKNNKCLFRVVRMSVVAPYLAALLAFVPIAAEAWEPMLPPADIPEKVGRAEIVIVGKVERIAYGIESENGVQVLSPVEYNKLYREGRADISKVFARVDQHKRLVTLPVLRIVEVLKWPPNRGIPKYIAVMEGGISSAKQKAITPVEPV